MIIWINGAFGSGKTQASIELNKRVENSIIFDPEETGFYIRDNMPKHLIPDDFQDIPLFRKFNYEMLKYTYENSDHDIIVPMTIVHDEYYEEIIGKLRKDNIEVCHFSLIASKETLLNRLIMRADSSYDWASKQIDRCMNALASEKYENKIYTDDLGIDEVVEEIIRRTKNEDMRHERY